MASNFRILTYRNSDSLHLKLAGDFDGSSACELLKTIERDRSKVSRIFIHCDCLMQINPFSRDVFLGEISELTKEPPSLLFTGGQAALIAPEENILH